MRPAVSLKFSVLCALLASAGLASSCEEKGITSTCPPLPLFDASLPDAASADGGTTQIILIATAVDAGCITAVTNFPYDASAGAGGESGDATQAGANTGDHAGAAGAR